MKLVTYEAGKKECLGVVTPADAGGAHQEQVADVAEVLRFARSSKLPSQLEGTSEFKPALHTLLTARRPPLDMIALLAAGENWRRALGRAVNELSAIESDAPAIRKLFRPLRHVRLKAPVTRPGKIIAVGLNYEAHAREQKRTPPPKPVYFGIYANAVIGPGDSIELPVNSRQVDWEAELAVVLGRRGKHIPEEQALDYVAGYTAYNDVSARDMQTTDRQFFCGKGCDTFAPLGPWIVTTDEITDPHNLSLSLRLNGALLQEANTSDLIFKLPRLISYLSESMTWEVGDILATGTPSGVGLYRQPPMFLQAGDTVSVTIEKIGALTNPVAGPPARP